MPKKLKQMRSTENRKQTGRSFDKAVIRTNWVHELNKHMKQDDLDAQTERGIRRRANSNQDGEQVRIKIGRKLTMTES